MASDVITILIRTVPLMWNTRVVMSRTNLEYQLFAMSSDFALPLHQHGKSRVGLGRVWREGNVHHFVEWNVNVMVESPM